MNKKLVVVRHAKSSWSDYSLEDIERPLNKRGKDDAPKMANKVKDIGINIEYFISSPAVRAECTCKVFLESFGKDKGDMEIVKNMYHGDVSDLMEAINLIDDNINCAALFAHNPGLTYFANEISNNYIENIPTCGVMIINVNQASWADVRLSSLSIDQLIYPKMYK